jgi:hypothetical protein
LALPRTNFATCSCKDVEIGRLSLQALKECAAALAHPQFKESNSGSEAKLFKLPVDHLPKAAAIIRD